ncbi:MAG: serine hydrolase domain-containing protein [Calditrichaceae bacterium]
MKIILGLIFIPFLIYGQSQSDYTSFGKDFDRYIDNAISRLSAQHGLAIGVVKDDRMIYEGYFGMADVENNIPVTSETDFYIASSTKSFTALAAQILADQNKIDLNRSLSAYFPEIEFVSELKADSVTMYHLLTHTSGLKNNPLVYLTAYTGNYTSEKLDRVLAEFTQVNDKYPFKQYAYTNFGYVVISMILEREMKKPWQDILAETIFRPLKMKQTSAYISDAQKRSWQLAKPYTQGNPENELHSVPLQKRDNTMHAAGGMISTVRDLSRWLITRLNDGRIDGEQVFSSHLIRKAHGTLVTQDRTYFDLHRFAYGFGWNIATTPAGDTLFHHYGGFPGFHAQVSFMPQYDIGVTVLCNENNQGQDLAYLLASYAFDYLSGKPGIDSTYATRLDSVKAQNDRWLKKINAHEAERTRRTWQLELPFSAYAGVYENDPMGRLIIRNPGDSLLVVELGNLKSPAAEPFVKNNSIRVEMIPGSGAVLKFEVANDKVVSTEFSGMVFTKSY